MSPAADPGLTRVSEDGTDGRIDDTADARVVRALFAAYRDGDRAAAERLVAPDFVFTSPQDDHIDRVAWFERCFPTAARFRTQRMLTVVDAGNGAVVVRYEYELVEGGRFRNMEHLSIHEGRLVAAEVFFGGPA
jgi:ketosteroid isomerase-like protein